MKTTKQTPKTTPVQPKLTAEQINTLQTELAALMAKQNNGLTAEQRKAAAIKAQASRTPEQRKDAARKAHITRAANRATRDSRIAEINALLAA